MKKLTYEIDVRKINIETLKDLIEYFKTKKFHLDSSNYELEKLLDSIHDKKLDLVEMLYLYEYCEVVWDRDENIFTHIMDYDEINTYKDMFSNLLVVENSSEGTYELAYYPFSSSATLLLHGYRKYEVEIDPECECKLKIIKKYKKDS